MDKSSFKDKQKCVRSTAGHSIQTIANPFQELVRIERLFQKVRIVAEGGIFAKHIIGVTAGVNDLESGLLRQQPRRQFAAGNVLGHDHVGEQKINCAALFLPDFQGAQSGIGLDDVITLAFQKGSRQGTHGSLVFDQQNGFLSAADFRGAGKFGLGFSLSGRRGR